MSRSPRSIYLLTLILLGGLVTPASGARLARPSALGAMQSLPGNLVTVRAAETDRRVPFVGPPEAYLRRARGAGAQTATIVVNYNGFSAEAQTAFQYAVDIWESLINSSVTIEIDANWTPLGPFVLGSAGAADYYANFTNAPVANTWYPVATANALSGTDINFGSAEINANFNSSFPAWYFGTDGNPPFSDYDFVSVVLHEIGHGLGFAGSGTVIGSLGSWGGGSGFPFIYDRFVYNGSNQQLIDTGLFGNPSVELATQLQSNNIFFTGANAVAANSGLNPKLYAPGTWAQGSSYSHLDEATYLGGTPNALMTPALFNGEAAHDPGPITLGMFEDMGWTTPASASDVSLTKQLAGNLQPAPGDPITFTLTLNNNGLATASQVVVTDTVPVEVTSPAFTASLVITQTAGPDFVWQVEPLASGVGGVITVTGTISGSLPSDFSFINTATVSDPADATPGNNTSSVAVPNHPLYLPLTLK